MTTVDGVDTRQVLTGWSLIDETDGFEVDNDMHDDPILVGPDGKPVTTWMEGYPYQERMTRRDYEITKAVSADRVAEAAVLGEGNRAEGGDRLRGPGRGWQGAPSNGSPST